MRFVRAYTRRADGALIAVMEQETPFEPQQGMEASEGELDVHDVGLAEDFEPIDPETEQPCSPARHLYARMERAPSAEPARGFRARPGLTLPPMLDCPCTLDGLRQRVRERGPAGLPAKARAWLALMLPPAESEALGVGHGIPISALRALDAQRQRRDPVAGSRMFVLERAAQERSDRHAASHLKARERRARPKEVNS